MAEDGKETALNREVQGAREMEDVREKRKDLTLAALLGGTATVEKSLKRRGDNKKQKQKKILCSSRGFRSIRCWKDTRRLIKPFEMSDEGKRLNRETDSP